MLYLKMKYNFITGITVILLIMMAAPATGQKARTIGLEVQGYPSGVITTLRGGLELSSRQELSVRLGYNLTRRGDFGEHDNEEGGGPGFSLGYRYYIKDELDGFFLGARTNLWFMEIDWRDENRIVCGIGPCPGDVSGTTDIIVLQPTAEVGYNLIGGRSSWLLAPVVAFGWEFNIRTEGETVGEGAILLGGLNISYLF